LFLRVAKPERTVLLLKLVWMIYKNANHWDFYVLIENDKLIANVDFRREHVCAWRLNYNVSFWSDGTVDCFIFMYSSCCRAARSIYTCRSESDNDLQRFATSVMKGPLGMLSWDAFSLILFEVSCRKSVYGVFGFGTESAFHHDTAVLLKK